MDCTTCENFASCVELCSAATVITDQDYKSQRELPKDTCVIELTPSSEGWQPPSGDFPYYEFLSPLQNEVLMLSRCETLSYVQIGEIVNRKPETIRSILYRAKIKIAHFSSYNRGAK